MRFFFPSLLVRSSGGTFLLQIAIFYRAITVSPAFARLPVAILLGGAIGHRAVSGESVPPDSVRLGYAGFVVIGQRAEGDAQGDFFYVPHERVGVPLWTLPTVAVEVARIRQGPQDLLDATVGDPLDLELPALEPVAGALDLGQTLYGLQDPLLRWGEGLPCPPQGLTDEPECFVEVLFGGEDAPFGVSVPLMLMQSGNHLNHVYEEPSACASACLFTVPCLRSDLLDHGSWLDGVAMRCWWCGSEDDRREDLKPQYGCNAATSPRQRSTRTASPREVFGSRETRPKNSPTIVSSNAGHA
jgi:hypothetical protein